MAKRKADVIQRGSAARTVLDSKAFQGALEDVRERIYRSWQQTTLSETSKREMLFSQLHGLDLVEGMLRTHVKSETIERERIEVDARKRSANIVPIYD